jgi:CheY-like chemotaxis protein
MAPDERDVLVVDDDDSIRVLLHRHLTRAGLTCDTAVDGEDALARVTASTYAVVLTDLVMPRLDGADFVLRLAELERSPDERPVVVMMTSHPESARLDALGRVVQAVVRKPLDTEELTEVIRACVHARRLPQGVRRRDDVIVSRIAPRTTSRF